MTCLRTAAHEGTELLTVLYFPFRVRTPLPKMIGRFLRKYPQVKFSVETIDISELERRLLDEKLDLGVGFLENNWQTLKTRELFLENLVAVANAKCGLKSARSISLEEIAAFPLVLLRSGFCTRELIEEGLNQTDIRANILAEFDSIDAIVSCVEEVPAISILPEHACHWRAYPGIKSPSAILSPGTPRHSSGAAPTQQRFCTPLDA
jgi:LysR family transcriptional regulator, cyn operon transcriptional activator